MTTNHQLFTAKLSNPDVPWRARRSEQCHAPRRARSRQLDLDWAARRMRQPGLEHPTYRQFGCLQQSYFTLKIRKGCIVSHHLYSRHQHVDTSSLISMWEYTNCALGNLRETRAAVLAGPSATLRGEKRASVACQGADMCASPQVCPSSQCGWSLEPLRSQYPPPPTASGFHRYRPETFFWSGCRNRPRPSDYRQRRSLLGYSFGYARSDQAAASLPRPVGWSVTSPIRSRSAATP
jgi:hypothetical protein